MRCTGLKYYHCCCYYFFPLGKLCSGPKTSRILPLCVKKELAAWQENKRKQKQRRLISADPPFDRQKENKQQQQPASQGEKRRRRRKGTTAPRQRNKGLLLFPPDEFKVDFRLLKLPFLCFVLLCFVMQFPVILLYLLAYTRHPVYTPSDIRQYSLCLPLLFSFSWHLVTSFSLSLFPSIIIVNINHRSCHPSSISYVLNICHDIIIPSCSFNSRTRCNNLHKKHPPFAFSSLFLQDKYK